MSTADPAKLFRKICIVQKQGRPIVNTLQQKIGPAMGKKGLAIKAAIILPPRLRLSTLQALNFF
jgi:hypothetical protein